MTIPTISTLPTAPARTDAPATFISRADAFLAALVTMQTELNTSIGAMNTDIAGVNADAASAAADAVSAAASAAAAEAASNATLWVSGTSYSSGDVVYSPIDYKSYRANTATSGTTDPSASADWTALGYELPNQTGNAGKFLTTDGSAESWGDVPSTGESDFVADGTIAIGDAVYLKSSGNIAKSEIAVASVGTQADIIPSDTKAISICEDPVNDKFVVFYMDTSDGDKGKAVVGTRSGTTVTYGTPVTFFSGSLFSSSANNISSTYDEANGQVIVAYATATDGGGLLRAGTVSGTSITFHTELDTGEYAQASGVCYDPSVDKILYNYFSSGSTGKAKVISNSGTTLTVLDTQQYATSVNGYTADAVHLKDYVTDGYNALSYNTSGVAYIIQARINTSTFALTFGSGYNVTDVFGYSGYAWGSQTLAWSSAYQRLIVLFGRGPSGNYELTSALHSVNGASWTRVASRGVDTSFFSNPYEDFPAISISPDGLSATVAYVDVGSSGFGKLKMSVGLSASSLTWGSEIQFEPNACEYMSLAYTQSGSNFVVAYARNAGFPRGKYVVGIVAIPDNRANVIGFSQTSVSAGETATVKTLAAVDANQSGLTPNTDYYLSASDGSTLTTTVNGQRVGLALSDTEILVTARS